MASFVGNRGYSSPRSILWVVDLVLAFAFIAPNTNWPKIAINGPIFFKSKPLDRPIDSSTRFFLLPNALPSTSLMDFEEKSVGFAGVRETPADDESSLPNQTYTVVSNAAENRSARRFNTEQVCILRCKSCVLLIARGSIDKNRS